MKRYLILCGLFIASVCFLGADVSHYYGASVPSQPLVTGQTVSYHDDDDGYLEKGVTHSYNVLTTGDYTGTTNIVINGKTHALSNNCVIDERTGLMWARYVPDGDIGANTDGKLFWDQYTLSAELCTFATAGDTITADALTPFVVAALPVGRKITISGTTNNNGVVTVTGITTSEITVSENLTDENSVSTTFATLGDLIWDFAGQANTNSLGGHADWYVPNINQLRSLTDISRSAPCIDVTTFPSTPAQYYWTSSTRHDGTINAFSLTFDTYRVNAYDKTTSQWYVRLVRDN